MTKTLITRMQLHPLKNGRMNYCPYCLKVFSEKNKNKNITYKDVMEPLVYVKYQINHETDNGDMVTELEEYWECKRCGKHLTADDFLCAYGARADGTSYSQPPRRSTNERLVTT